MENTAYMEGSQSYSVDFCFFGEGWTSEMGLLAVSLQRDLVLRERMYRRETQTRTSKAVTACLCKFRTSQLTSVSALER